MFGIDISENNGHIDWSKVRQDPQQVEFAYIKVSEGIGFNDRQLGYNASECQRAGIQIGYYHFASLNNLDVIHDAANEANFFLSSISKLPANDLPLILDIETNKIGLSQAQTLQWINAFFDVLRAKQKTLAIYSYTPFLNSNLPTNHLLGYIPLWIAQYNEQPSPVLPKGWRDHYLWQYTNKGKVGGIMGNVDLNKK